jgi:hypothetical protein
MKKSIFIALFLIPFNVIAQQGQFNAQNAYEVGRDYSVSFEITDSTNMNQIATVQWFLSLTAGGDIVPGELEQQTNILHFVTNFPDPIYVSEFNNGNGNEVDFKFGNFALANEQIRIIVTYTDSSGTSQLIDNKWVNVNIISQPTISGPSDIQECCVDFVTYTASGYQNANVFDWSINSGGTIVLDNGTSIVVQPSLTSPISVDCQVSRQESVPDYNYGNSKNTTRSQVVTPPIQGIPISKGVEYLCLGDIYELFLDLDGFCGDIDEVIWTIPQGFEVQSIDDEVITIAPTQSMLYQSFDIKAQLRMAGGCLATTVTHNVTIFQNGTPPTPQGYITVTSDPVNIDPCKDYALFFDFVRTDGFQNGIITISPKVFIGVPHHIKGRTTIDVRVCYYNPCSDIEVCRTFVVNLPAPCPDHPRIANSSTPIAESQKHDVVGISNNEEILEVQKVRIFPNPTKGILHIDYPNEVPSRIRIMDMSGKVVLEKQKTQSNQVLNLQNLAQGLYVVEVFLMDEVVRKLIIVE